MDEEVLFGPQDALEVLLWRAGLIGLERFICKHHRGPGFIFRCGGVNHVSRPCRRPPTYMGGR